MDLGVLWGAVNQNEVERLVAKYFTDLQKQSRATLEAKLILPNHAMRPLIHQISRNGFSETNLNYLAKSFASSMSYWEDFEIESWHSGLEDE